MKAEIVLMGFLPTDGIINDGTYDCMKVYSSIVESMRIVDEDWIKASEILIRNAIQEMKDKNIPREPKKRGYRRGSLWNIIKGLERVNNQRELLNEGDEDTIESVAEWYETLCEDYHAIDFEKAKYISVGDCISPSLLEMESHFYKTEDEKKQLENTFTRGLYKFKYRVINKLWQDDTIKFHIAAYGEDDIFETRMLYNQYLIG